MTVTNVLAVVPTAGFDAASTWYERFAGRPADRVPMDGCSEWQLGQFRIGSIDDPDGNTITFGQPL